TVDSPAKRPGRPRDAAGAIPRLTSPPRPPLAPALAIESPPVTDPGPDALPARPLEMRCADPALPPLPATARPLTVLVAAPVSPETATTEDDAPELASLTAVPSAVALPVGPLLPLSPERVSDGTANAAGRAGAVAGAGAPVLVAVAAPADVSPA